MLLTSAAIIAVIVASCRYVELAVQLLQKRRHMKWKHELQEKKLTHLAFDTVRISAPRITPRSPQCSWLTATQSPGVLGAPLGGAACYDV